MSSPHTLLTLPQELRDEIYKKIEQEDDLGSLMHRCRQLRSEVVSRLPGGEEKRIDYTVATKDDVQDQIAVFSVHITVSGCDWSSARFLADGRLGCEVKWKSLVPLNDDSNLIRSTRWSTNNTHSPMARFVSFYHEYWSPDEHSEGLFLSFDPPFCRFDGYWNQACCHFEEALGILRCGDFTQWNCQSDPANGARCSCRVGVAWKGLAPLTWARWSVRS